MTCTINQNDTDGTEWDEMSEMMVTTKQMTVIRHDDHETYLKKYVKCVKNIRIHL